MSQYVGIAEWSLWEKREKCGLRSWGVGFTLEMNN